MLAEMVVDIEDYYMYYYNTGKFNIYIYITVKQDSLLLLCTE